MSLSLVDVYQLFGFKQEKCKYDNIHVFTQNNGYYHNADLVVDETTDDSEKIKRDLESAGFTVAIRHYKSVEDAEWELFKGFFNIDETKKCIKARYDEFAEKNKKVIGGEYTYLPSRFLNYQTNDCGDKNLVDCLMNEVKEKGPKLIIIEAAAGYGKTSTVYEFIKTATESAEMSNSITFLAELYRNRQAKIFKYVLLDEIDRNFPSIKRECFEYYVKKGKIILIVDGFDELIQQKGNAKDSDDTLNEAMLETIASLLTENAKIIITARKTAVFSEGPFSQWKLSHEKDFCIKRYEIQEPEIEDWLPASKIRSLIQYQIDLKKFPNPLLLGWLRCQKEDFFSESFDSEVLLERYFGGLLNREKERQDLPANSEEQKRFLMDLSGYLMDFRFDCLPKNDLEDYIKQYQNKFISTIQSRYSAEDRTSYEELIEKICMHALLDRKNNRFVGFVNDFTFGYFLGEYIIDGNADDKWELFVSYLDRIFLAFGFRSEQKRSLLWDKLNSLCEVLEKNGDETKWKYKIDKILKGSVQRDYENLTFEHVVFENDMFVDDFKCTGNSFFNCVFKNVIFSELTLKNNLFFNCKFYNCKWPNIDCSEYENNLMNCDGSPHSEKEKEVKKEIFFSDGEQRVLKRFWPDGSSSPMKQKQIQSIKSGGNYGCDEALESLRKRGFLTINSELVTLNPVKIGEIWSGLRRGQND